LTAQEAESCKEAVGGDECPCLEVFFIEKAMVLAGLDLQFNGVNVHRTHFFVHCIPVSENWESKNQRQDQEGAIHQLLRFLRHFRSGVVGASIAQRKPTCLLPVSGEVPRRAEGR
jgi:hypothetical protein